MIIQPINETQEQQVCEATFQLLNQTRELYKVNFTNIPVKFDLKGRAAGMYLVKNKQRYIRYNPYLFAKYFDDNLETTVPHEVAHYVTDMLYGLRRIKPHGNEWQSVMRDLGVNPSVTAKYDLTGIPVRQQKRFTYQCNCTSHLLSTVRHNKINLGKAQYHCRYCGTIIRLEI